LNWESRVVYIRQQSNPKTRWIAAWLQQADANDSLGQLFSPQLEDGERKIAEIEGWILGVA
jgi:hypothetical protein